MHFVGSAEQLKAMAMKYKRCFHRFCFRKWVQITYLNGKFVLYCEKHRIRV